MAAPVEEAVLNALRGHLSENTKLPAPLIIKVYVASLKKEFREERRILLEVIGPELQSIYDDRQIEIELVDMHFGTGPDGAVVDYDPLALKDHLREIEMCSKVSKSIFFIVLIDDHLGAPGLPLSIPTATLNAIIENSTTSQIAIINEWYTSHPSTSHSVLSPDYRSPDRQTHWLATTDVLRSAIFAGINGALRRAVSIREQQQELCDQLEAIKRTALEMEIYRALEYRPQGIMAIFREWSTDAVMGDGAGQQATNDGSSCVSSKRMKSHLTECLPSTNHVALTVQGARCDIDPESDVHDDYLGEFKSMVVNKMRNSIDLSLINDPDCIKGRKKTVQEIFHEHTTHLRLLNKHAQRASIVSSQLPDRIKASILLSYRSGARHGPFFIHGDHGTGKSSLIAEIYTNVTKWVENGKVHRVIRFAAASPRSAYNLELLRVICQQISIICNIPEGYLPKDASFDPLYIYNWFQNLIRRCEDLSNEVLFLFIDDLHKLNPLDCDIVAALSWMPISLPWNVYLICSTRVPIESLRLTPMQKERFRSSECMYSLTQEVNVTQLKHVREAESLSDYVERLFNEIEVRFGVKGCSRLATYITCSEYGLTETELLELLMPIHNSEANIETAEGFFNFSSFRCLLNHIAPILTEKLMSGKILLQWRHQLCADVARTRYMDPESTRAVHTEIANIFFNQDVEESDDTSSVKSTTKSDDGPDTIVALSAQGDDVSYSTRHVEESWHHLMKSEDTAKFKQIAVCNFDFLLAANPYKSWKDQANDC